MGLADKAIVEAVELGAKTAAGKAMLAASEHLAQEALGSLGKFGQRANRLLSEATNTWSGPGVFAPENHLLVRELKLLANAKHEIEPTLADLKLEGDSEMAEIHRANRPSILQVHDGHGYQGSGYVADQGLAVTADHVVLNNGRVSKKVSLTLTDGSNLKARVVMRAPDQDLALLAFTNGDRVPSIPTLSVMT